MTTRTNAVTRRSMARVMEPTFGQAIRAHRRELNLGHAEIAHSIKVSTPYIGHLEAGKRHPSERVIERLAGTLGLEQRDLFLLANPGVKALVAEQPKSDASSVWEAFRRDSTLREVHRISDQEMQVLSRLAVMGEVRSSTDFLFVLNSIRRALGKIPKEHSDRIVSRPGSPDQPSERSLLVTSVCYYTGNLKIRRLKY